MILATEKTPAITFDSTTSTFRMEGICAPENSSEFFEQVEPYFLKQNQHLTAYNFEIYLDYFNTSSSKELLNLLINLKGDTSKEIQIIWLFIEDDEEIREAGEMYEAILKTKFIFKEVK